jgi:hypothetical protein
MNLNTITTMEAAKNNDETITLSKQDYYKSLGLKTYTKPDYIAPQYNAQAVNKLKTAMKKDIQALKKEMRTALSNKQQFPDQGKTLPTLVDKWNNGDETLREELNGIKYLVTPKDVTAKQAGISYQDKQNLLDRVYTAKQELFVEKTGFYPSGENLRKIGQALNLYTDQQWSKGLNDTKMFEMVLLDDFSDMFKKIAGYALPLVKNGLKVASTVYPSLTPLTMASQMLESAQGYFSKPSKQEGADLVQTVMPTINKMSDTLNAGVKQTRFNMDAVDMSTIASVLGPEFYKNVGRFDDALPAATSTYFTEIPVIPATANGAFFFVLNNTINCAINYQSFICYGNANAVYNPQTGAFDFTKVSNIQNPLLALNTTIAASRILGVSVTYVPNVQTNTNATSGQVELYHDPSLNLLATDFYATPSPYLSQNNVGYKPFYQKGPVTQTLCQLYYNPLDNSPFIEPTSAAANNMLSSPIVLIVSGANLTAQQIGTIQVNIVFNNTPTSTGLATQPISNPRLGPYTADFINSCLTEVPQIFMAPLETRMDIITKLLQTDERYGPLMETVTGCCTRKKQPYQSSNNGGSGWAAKRSLDLSMDEL